jgi:hypothetical protein
MVIIAPSKIAVSCQKTVYTKLLTPSAEAVRTVLNQNGVVLNRMALIALPAVSKGAVSQTAEDHARNRRVSIAVVE